MLRLGSPNSSSGKGYACEDEETARLVRRWSGRRADAWVHGRSADFLRRSRKLHDLDFVLGHVDDLASVYRLVDGEVIAEDVSRPPASVDLERAVHA